MKNITQLINSKTEKYLTVKSYLIGEEIPWYWASSSTETERLLKNNSKYTDVSFLSHTFISRPETSSLSIPHANSSKTQEVCEMLKEILKLNEISVECFLRISLNCVFPQGKILNSYPHKDHAFPHKNLLIYLTDSGGEIVVGKEVFDPKEDDVILFDGTEEHFLKTPKEKRRVSLIATFI